MWIFFAIISMLGTTFWYIFPKFFPPKNPFAVLFFAGIFMSILAILAGKFWLRTEIFDKNFFAFSLAAAVAMSVPTIGIFFAFAHGGRVGPIAIITEFSVILATIFSIFYFREKINWLQISGIFLATAGIFLVILGGKKI